MYLHKQNPYEKKRYIALVLLAEVAILLLLSFSTYYFCQYQSLQISVLPTVILASFMFVQILRLVCLFAIDKYRSRPRQANSSNLTANSNPANASTSPDGSPKSAQERMVQFHSEYTHERTQYLQQKEKVDMEKLEVILKYTRETFKRLELDETEVFQICESVRYFVTRHQVMPMTKMQIRKRSHITQIALKNFAWNIAFQYGIEGELTAEFLLTTFREWFANSTLDTIRKNLRTTTGRHSIEIDEHIIYNRLANDSSHIYFTLV